VLTGYRQTALRWQELYTGFYSELERLTPRCAKCFAGTLINQLEDFSTKVLQFILQLNLTISERYE
jgi:hypothetical protein